MVRVGQWATGGVGAISVAAMARRPDLDLVAVVVHDPAKVGEAFGGVAATDDPTALLGLDAVCYAASGEARPAEAADDLCRLLEAGTNVVTTSVPGLVHPPAYDADATARLRAVASAS